MTYYQFTFNSWNGGRQRNQTSRSFQITLASSTFITQTCQIQSFQTPLSDKIQSIGCVLINCQSWAYSVPTSLQFPVVPKYTSVILSCGTSSTRCTGSMPFLIFTLRPSVFQVYFKFSLQNWFFLTLIMASFSLETRRPFLIQP